MLKQSLLSLLMIFCVGFPLMGAQQPQGPTLNAADITIQSIQNQMDCNHSLNNRDQYIKYVAILLPTAIVGAAILKSWKGNLSEQGGALSVIGGALSAFFSACIIRILSDQQTERNTANTKLREELTKISTK